MDLKSKIILISGPTASGKSEFAIKVAKKINGEIINADSMQVYKELNSLTARPKKKDQKKIKTIGDLQNIVNSRLRSSDKTILIAIINNQNQRRYIGVKLE